MRGTPEMDPTWHSGMNVVCICNTPRDGMLNVYCHLLEEGRIYTIRSIIEYQRPHVHVGISLEQLCHPFEQLGISWHPDRFKPCKAVNIDILREICEKVSSKNLEPV